MKHGAKKYEYICNHDGCTNKAKSKGVCYTHGAKRKPRKKCEYEECNNIARRLGVCYRHGAPA